MTLMAYVSMAQARKFHSDPALQKYAPEFDKATPNLNALPERAGKPVLADKKGHKKRRHDAISSLLAHPMERRG